MARTCPCCGFGPIDVFTDSCPMCGEQAFGDGANPFARLTNQTLWLLIGWAVIGLGLTYLLGGGDWIWLLLSLGLCGAAWWAVVQPERLLLRLLGGSLLVLFLPGIWLAAQPGILPGLDG